MSRAYDILVGGLSRQPLTVLTEGWQGGATGIDGNATGSLPTVLVLEPEALASGDALATVVFPSISLSVLAAVATGTAATSPALPEIALAPLVGQGHGAANSEAGSLAASTVTAPAASAVGGAVGVGGLLEVAVNVPAITYTLTANVAPSLPSVVCIAPEGIASVHVEAVVSLPVIVATPFAATAVGSAQNSASLPVVVQVAPQVVASGSANCVGENLASVTLIAVEGWVTVTSFANLPSVASVAPAALASAAANVAPTLRTVTLYPPLYGLWQQTTSLNVSQGFVATLSPTRETTETDNVPETFRAILPPMRPTTNSEKSPDSFVTPHDSLSAKHQATQTTPRITIN